ncbi:MAG TPA: Ig-like domain-containing protein [Solimonas sp.]|nr:Ig-like domain-containing protein [Solimonas sp.]
MTQAAVAAGTTVQLTAAATTSTTVPPGTNGTETECPTGTPKESPVICNRNENVSSRATWSSSDVNVATVDGTGLVTTKKVGSSVITAAFGGLTAQTTVTVSPATLVGVQVVPDTASIPAGNTQLFRLRGVFSDQVVRDITASDGTVTWASANPTVATVDPATGITTTATGQSVGTVAITGTLARSTGSSLSDSGFLTVTNAVLTSVLRIEPASPLVIVGGTVQLVAIGRYSDNSEAQIPQSSVAWTSGTPAVATITNGSSGGVATGVAQGESTITATVAGAGSATTVLTVTDSLCTGPLLASAGATTVTASNVACLGCTVTQPENAIDNDLATSATLSQPLGLLAGEVSIAAVQSAALPLIAGGRPAGFLISRPAALPLSLEVLNQLRIATVVRGAGDTLIEVESFTQGPDTIPGVLRLTLLGAIGGVETALVTVNTTAGNDYAGVRAAFTSGVATLLGSVNVNSSCATATLPVTP